MSHRRGVTLIELLVVILIISILAALVLGVAAVAGETARRAQTRHLVERLHGLLTEHMATYKSRRVGLRKSSTGLRDGIEDQIADAKLQPALRGLALAEARLYAMREMMLMEIPDHWSDITLAANGDPIGNPLYLDAGQAAGQYRRTPLAAIYLRKYQQLATSGIDPEVLRNNEGAECLYMIIMNATGDGEAHSLFSTNDIGDTDGDGALEFLDGWGHPINFLRWAPGFDSQIQSNARNLDTPLKWQVAADRDHDPYDIYHADNDAFRLVPLIYSPGRDESSGLTAPEEYVYWAPKSTKLTFANSGPHVIRSPQLLTCQKLSIGGYFGDDVGDGTSTDNIHNHLLGLR